MLTYVYLSTHTVTITLADTAAAAVTGATVFVTVVDQGGTEITGQTWPLALSDQSDGTYTGTFDSDWGVSVGQIVLVQVTATKGSQQRYAELRTQVQVDRD